MPTLDERMIRIPINEIIRYGILLSEFEVVNCSKNVMFIAQVTKKE